MTRKLVAKGIDLLYTYSSVSSLVPIVSPSWSMPSVYNSSLNCLSFSSWTRLAMRVEAGRKRTLTLIFPRFEPYTITKVIISIKFTQQKKHLEADFAHTGNRTIFGYFFAWYRKVENIGNCHARRLMPCSRWAASLRQSLRSLKALTTVTE